MTTSWLGPLNMTPQQISSFLQKVVSMKEEILFRISSSWTELLLSSPNGSSSMDNFLHGLDGTRGVLTWWLFLDPLDVPLLLLLFDWGVKCWSSIESSWHSTSDRYSWSWIQSSSSTRRLSTSPSSEYSDPRSGDTARTTLRLHSVKLFSSVRWKLWLYWCRWPNAKY